MKSVRWFAAASVIVLSSAVHGIDTNKYHAIDVATATADDYRAVYDAMMACTNKSDMKAIAVATKFFTVACRKDLVSVANEFDRGLAQRKIDNFPSLMCMSTLPFPETTRYIREANGIQEDFVRTIATAERLKCSADVMSLVYRGNAGVDELVTYLDEMSAYSTNFMHYSVGSIENITKAKLFIQKRAAVEIKRKLRTKGISFVSKDGTNPCETYMTALNVALNAPRFEGLNAWLDELGFSARIDESKLPSRQLVDEIRNKVFYGDATANKMNSAILFVGLGADGYNAFVREYNGDK